MSSHDSLGRDLSRYLSRDTMTVLHAIHHGGLAGVLAICFALAILWIVLKMAEYAIIPE